MSLLSVQALSVWHGLLQAVRGVSLAINQGEVIALVGANGAGKTTLLRAIAGAHIPAKGTIVFKGRDVTLLPAHERAGIGIALVPEGRRLFGQMTVEENLLLARSARRQGLWTIETVMQAFPQLVPRRRAKAGNLSGGEQQAVAIGRALMTNPDLLLLDEVSLGLSPLAVDRVYDALRDLIRLGATVVLVEQDLTRAMAVAGRVLCMLEGRVVLEGSTRDLTRETITDAYFGLQRAGGTAA
ncbi:ABC transporter ATP-binding protein [Bradyrhizobium liaoningense]|uniref:ABC transporter ATP-binding protein n=1 Tax=Bradyrhizobium liaoningense TaxID=43992 RepID=UPI001BA537C4|nr:ABC transporter ATP-binding protein [Bradyrhizobium liaoningense]MBR0706252.1 ABC transporter ATP-binding protein [Bradyrhizobium liaoningense]